MIECERCKAVFSFQSRLNRHLNRKFPCKENTQNSIKNTQNSIKNTQNSISDTQNSVKNTQNSTDVIKLCKYCNMNFGKHIKRHETVCKLGNDEVRLLEIELDIPYKSHDKLTCRFCNKIFTRSDTIAKHDKKCDDKQIYYETLKKKQKKEEKPVPQNITNIINNNTQINIVASNGEPLRKFGDENFDALNEKDFIKIMRIGNDGDVGVLAMIMNKIHFNPNYPENKNIKLTNLRSEQIAVYNGERFVMKPVDNIIYKTIRSASNLMDEMYCTINEEKSNKCENDMLVRSTFNVFDDGHYDVRSRKAGNCLRQLPLRNTQRVFPKGNSRSELPYKEGSKFNKMLDL